MILRLFSHWKFRFRIFYRSGYPLFEVEIIPYVTLPATVIDHGQPSYVFDSSPFRLIMSSLNPWQEDGDPGPLEEDGDPGPPQEDGDPEPPQEDGDPGPPPGPLPDVSNKILISIVADISRERTIDIKYGMNLS